MQNFKKKFVPFRVGKSLSGNQCPKTHAEMERMRGIPYASAIESLMYAILLQDQISILFMGMVSRYQSDPDEEY